MKIRKELKYGDYREYNQCLDCGEAWGDWSGEGFWITQSNIRLCSQCGGTNIKKVIGRFAETVIIATTIFQIRKYSIYKFERKQILNDNQIPTEKSK